MNSFQDQLSALEKYEKKVYEYRLKEANILLAIGEIYLDEDDPEKALENLQEAKKLYQKIEYSAEEAYTQDLIGDCYRAISNISKAIKHYEKAFKIYSDWGYLQKNEIKDKIQKLKKIDSILKKNQKVKTSFSAIEVKPTESTYHRPYKSNFQKDGKDKINSGAGKPLEKDSEELTDRLDELVMLLDQSGLYSIYSKDPNSIEIFKEALKTAEVIEDWNTQGILHLMLGDSKLKKKNTEDALKHFNQALEMFKKNSNEKGEAIALLLMGAVFFFIDREEEMYKILRNSLQILKEYNHKKEENLALELIKLLSS